MDGQRGFCFGVDEKWRPPADAEVLATARHPANYARALLTRASHRQQAIVHTGSILARVQVQAIARKLSGQLVPETLAQKQASLQPYVLEAAAPCPGGGHQCDARCSPVCEAAAFL